MIFDHDLDIQSHPLLFWNFYNEIRAMGICSTKEGITFTDGVCRDIYYRYFPIIEKEHEFKLYTKSLGHRTNYNDLLRRLVSINRVFDNNVLTESFNIGQYLPSNPVYQELSYEAISYYKKDKWNMLRTLIPTTIFANFPAEYQAIINTRVELLDSLKEITYSYPYVHETNVKQMEWCEVSGINIKKLTPEDWTLIEMKFGQ